MSHSVRIWLIDKLYPELSFEEFSDLAEDMAEKIFEANKQNLSHDVSQFTREGRKPNDIKIKLENGETINIKELYFVCDNDNVCIIVPDRRKYKCFYDEHYSDFACMGREINAQDETLFKIYEYVEELCGDEHAELKGKYKETIQDKDGTWWAYRDWIDENPDWDFKKVVLDALPEYIIKADYNS